MLGSVAPDADIVLAPRGWDIYLRLHEIGTHTLAGSPLVAAAVAGVLALVLRRARFATLFFAAWVGVVVAHVGFDLVSGSAIRFLAPFSDRRLGWHLLTFGDLSAAVILLAGALVMVRARRAGAIATLAALAALLVAKTVSQEAARDAYTSALASRGEQQAWQGRPDAINGSLFNWKFYDRYGDHMRAWQVNARSHVATLDFLRPVPQESPAITAARHVPVVRNFLALADLPFARIEPDDGGQRVLWSEIRFCSRTTCDLSFGASMGSDLVPTRQVIEIGWYRQIRGVAK